ncbi:DUF423 domain-containing protein [Roseixanthobacter liquoris]|uniref:DUF423 domain-containing protein n=1 Tax=Roseixanthobacter liquoris TaxID=3119921 RepID=UPI00372963A0
MNLWLRSLLCVAGLYGAAGVGASAVAAHLAGGTSLATAAQFLLLGALTLACASALCANLERGRTSILVGASAIGLGTLLFSGDLALRALMDVKLLWGTAPTGGTLMIAGWLVFAIGGARASWTKR